MTSHPSNPLGFQKKYIIGWLITGLIFGIVAVIYESSSGMTANDTVGFLLGMPIVMVINGFVFFFLEAAIAKKFRFSEVEHPQWFWYIYPMAFAGILVIGWLIGMIMGKKK